MRGEDDPIVQAINARIATGPIPGGGHRRDDSRYAVGSVEDVFQGCKQFLGRHRLADQFVLAADEVDVIAVIGGDVDEGDVALLEDAGNAFRP